MSNIINFDELGFKNLKKELDEELILTYTVKGQDVKIKTTIPTEDKIELCSVIISTTVDADSGFFNPYKLKIVSAVEGLAYYSNIQFNENKYHNIYDIYDILDDEGFIDILYSQTDFGCLFKLIEECTKSVVKYNNSAIGILEKIQRDPIDLSNQMAEILNTLKTDPDMKDFINNVLPTLQQTQLQG